MPEIASYWQANCSRLATDDPSPRTRRNYGGGRQIKAELITGSSMKLRALLILSAAHLLASSALAQLTAADVTKIINQAVTRAVKVSPDSVIAVTDREGYVLGVWVVPGGVATPGALATAVSKAGTA